MQVKYQYYDLGRLKRGADVVVTLRGNAANVRLMDAHNYRAFSRNARHKYVGGLFRTSPVRLRIPNDGHWYVTVDLGGLGGSVRSGVRVEQQPTALPPFRETSDLASLSGIRHEAPPHFGADDEQVWDVFISHASEDKAAVAKPLADYLQAAGLKVWLDVSELRIGDSLRRKIDRGLARSTFGVIVLSGPFFAKGWPQYELDGLISRHVSGEQNLLPIWHNITKDEVMAQSPSLADKIARSTAQFTIEEIAREIADVVRPSEAA
ncbi:DUF1883 domain-containing protein [Streptomyces fulvoviolaceus]|uniref:DUF1883 domain-containing protein n=1 Tax=Streptomyces fulvoviolaceus TaxID=285535 RepID=UPI0021C249C0|nr:DUF1883 domain-containing protein [Streptomyces fulvoviolaceus]MCT9077002.1 DUF1883 domain-containing protein [Streptomyces fulvoviolaceus]